jgi:RAB6A-GEF complex partner protein 1
VSSRFFPSQKATLQPATIRYAIYGASDFQDTISRPLLLADDSLLLYKGYRQNASDIINPESRNFARIPLPPGCPREYLPLRSVSVSSDVRYISVAAKIGFSHFSTVSGRWRTLDHEDEDGDLAGIPSIPCVRGGMCWFDNLLIVGADIGDSHEVSYRGALNNTLDPDLPSQWGNHEP